MKKKILIGDIGGTHFILSIIEISKKSYSFITTTRFNTQEVVSVENCISQYVQNEVVLHAVFAVAGIKSNDSIFLTNSNLQFSKQSIIQNTQLEQVELLNDFTAISNGIHELEYEEQIYLNHLPSLQEKKAVIGAGTGLGTSFINCGGEIIASEKGHSVASFNINDIMILSYISNLLQKEVVEWEDILSGGGIERIYSFFSNDFSKSAEEISEMNNEYSKKTFETFFYFYAKYAQQIALTFLPEGGIYIGGGIITRNIDKIPKEEFISHFTNHSKFDYYLKKIPLVIIKNYDISLKGLAHYCMKKYNKNK